MNLWQHIIAGNEEVMRKPPAETLAHAPEIFTATICVRLDCPSMKHKLFSDLDMKTTDTIVGICSNYTVKLHPGFEYLRRAKREAALAPAGRKKRAQEGDGQHLNSSITFHVRMPRGDDCKLYNLKLFPFTGRVQLYGITDENHAREALPVINSVCSFLEPVYGRCPEVRDLAPTLINAKTSLNWTNPQRQVLDLANLMNLLATPQVKEASPFPISSMQMSLDSDRLCVYFRVAEGRDANMNLFVRGKVNIMASTSNEVTRRIYEFFRDLLKKYWEVVTFIIPLPDYLWELRGGTLKVAEGYEAIWMRLLYL